ncbi:DoxX family protein [Dactylosporangium darangshiense]|uniref:DoxX family protein n=1 Tax=Dactylosporangium darangshiense TaxID=579108 RepID=A0ABP8DHP3_9ACTN
MTLASAILAGLLALVFLALGTAKILTLAPMRVRAAEAGFSTAAYRRIGVLEIAGATGLLTGLIEPPIGGLAGAGLLLLLGAAVVVHLRNGDGPRKSTPAVICGLLVASYLMLHLGTTR